MANSETKEARPSVFIALFFFLRVALLATLLLGEQPSPSISLQERLCGRFRSVPLCPVSKPVPSISPMVTAGGLVFTGAAMDNFFRAFDSETGKELWNYELPAGGQATPMTYIFRGKQYVVIAAGGHGKLGTKQGDTVIAFALP